MYAAGWLLSLAGLGTFAAMGAVGLTGTAKGVEAVAVASVGEIALVLLSVGLVAAALAQGSQRRADGWQDYFGPSPFLVVLAWLSLSLAVELAVIGVIAIVGIGLATSIETLLVLLLNLACYVVLVQVVAVRPGALSWRDIVQPGHLAPDLSDWSFYKGWAGAQAGAGKPSRALAGDIGLGLALAIPILIATLVFTGILVVILGLQDVSTSDQIPTLFPGWDLWITLLSLAVVAPIGEEIFFRGFATNAWARSLKRNQAIIRAAIFFASIHIINLLGAVDLDVLIPAAFLAVAARIPVAWALTWIYTRRRSIFASIALHGAYNGSLVLLIWGISQITFD
jgi:membrane protease YdiL (CAAX protease family)